MSVDKIIMFQKQLNDYITNHTSITSKQLTEMANDVKKETLGKLSKSEPLSKQVIEFFDTAYVAMRSMKLSEIDSNKLGTDIYNIESSLGISRIHRLNYLKEKVDSYPEKIEQFPYRELHTISTQLTILYMLDSIHISDEEELPSELLSKIIHFHGISESSLRSRKYTEEEYTANRRLYDVIVPLKNKIKQNFEDANRNTKLFVTKEDVFNLTEKAIPYLIDLLQSCTVQLENNGTTPAKEKYGYTSYFGKNPTDIDYNDLKSFITNTKRELEIAIAAKNFKRIGDLIEVHNSIMQVVSAKRALTSSAERLGEKQYNELTKISESVTASLSKLSSDAIENMIKDNPARQVAIIIVEKTKLELANLKNEILKKRQDLKGTDSFINQTDKELEKIADYCLAFDRETSRKRNPKLLLEELDSRKFFETLQVKIQSAQERIDHAYNTIKNPKEKSLIKGLAITIKETLKMIKVLLTAWSRKHSNKDKERTMEVNQHLHKVNEQHKKSANKGIMYHAALSASKAVKTSVAQQDSLRSKPE